jgi:hypothetical protein
MSHEDSLAPYPARGLVHLHPRYGEPVTTDPSELSDQDLAVLDLARRQWAGPGARDRAIRERLGISPTRYFQLLNALLDDARALAHDPLTVNRLRRARDARRGSR